MKEVQRFRQNGKIVALYLCICGKEKVCQVYLVEHGKTKSCGCFHKKMLSNKAWKASSALITHGMTKSRTYKSWCAMKERCTNPNFYSFHNYGGRGITICERWIYNFQNFLDDMGIRPENKSLDRINTNGNYEPSNCKWATRKEQANNRRNNKKITNCHIP